MRLGSISVYDEAVHSPSLYTIAYVIFSLSLSPGKLIGTATRGMLNWGGEGATAGVEIAAEDL